MHSQFLLYVYLYCEARWLLFATIEEEPMHLFFFLTRRFVQFYYWMANFT